jgi:hypothetical protein
MFRQWYARNVEKRLKRRVSLLWKIEWVPRKSGVFRYENMPHYHMLMFNCPDVDKRFVWDEWMRAIGEKKYVNVDCEECSGEHGAALYVSKYVGKDSDSLLGNCTKHTKAPGRPWGTLRLDLFPCSIQKTLILPPSDAVDRAYSYAESLQVCNPSKRPISFRLLGEKCDQAVAALVMEELDKCHQSDSMDHVG